MHFEWGIQEQKRRIKPMNKFDLTVFLNAYSIEREQVCCVLNMYWLCVHILY
jgi:hypothetical protein